MPRGTPCKTRGRVDRYSFLVRLFHPLLHTGFIPALHLLTIINSLRERKVGFRSLTEGMDTTTASGELLFHVFGALAQYERALTRERVIAGLAAAKRRGRVGGRPPALAGEKREAVIAALEAGMSKAAVCRNFGVKRTTLIETLARLGWPNTGGMTQR